MKRISRIECVKEGEDMRSYLMRENIEEVNMGEELKRILGYCNPGKEGDISIGVGTEDIETRNNARILLSNTRIGELHEHPIHKDSLQELIWNTIDPIAFKEVEDFKFSQLKNFLLTQSPYKIKALGRALNSDIIAGVTKLMSNNELVKVCKKVFNELPGSNIGGKGFLSGRVQPNSPTDNPIDIMWQVFSAWSFATGDLILGTNPVSDNLQNLLQMECVLKDIITTFNLKEVLPWCVLTHISHQSLLESKHPKSTAIWFQSIAGCDEANHTFGISTQGMLDYAEQRKGENFGLYLETGQGSDFTNGSGMGFDMVMHESRKYGFARALGLKISISNKSEGNSKSNCTPWIHVNDVAGFIGPEVFRTPAQLIRVCLEDTFMGKLHGLTHGLDICATLHMDISPEDLEECQEEICKANPAYLMALPTKNDPMLSYLTTGYHDHVRLREKFGYQVDNKVWEFYKKLGVVGEDGQFTQHFGDPIWVYYQYLLAKGDTRGKEKIFAEGEQQIAVVQARGVPIARGWGATKGHLPPAMKDAVTRCFHDAKDCIWREFTPDFLHTFPSLLLTTMSKSRQEYLYYPPTGETLSEQSKRDLEIYKKKHPMGEVQIVISDGLNAPAIMDSGHLAPYLDMLQSELRRENIMERECRIVLQRGRVRGGYEIGRLLFGSERTNTPPLGSETRCVVHIIGERPGTGHHNYSVYITNTTHDTWGKGVDHNITRVISGISDTAYSPLLAAKDTLKIIIQMADQTDNTSLDNFFDRKSNELDGFLPADPELDKYSDCRGSGVDLFVIDEDEDGFDEEGIYIYIYIYIDEVEFDRSARGSVVAEEAHFCTDLTHTIRLPTAPPMTSYTASKELIGLFSRTIKSTAEFIPEALRTEGLSEEDLLNAWGRILVMHMQKTTDESAELASELVLYKNIMEGSLGIQEILKQFE